MVRTDCRAQKLDAFLQPKEKPPSEPEPARPSCSRENKSFQPDSVEMDNADDADMLEALAEQEAEPQTGEEDRGSAGDLDVQR